IGLDVEYFRPAPADPNLRLELGLPNGQLLVGIISYLRTYKGHEYFIEAARRIAEKRDDVTFIIVGEGPEEQTIRTLIERLGLKSPIRKKGLRGDPVQQFPVV